jgi:hypothetical protein
MNSHTVSRLTPVASPSKHTRTIRERAGFQALGTRGGRQRRRLSHRSGAGQMAHLWHIVTDLRHVPYRRQIMPGRILKSAYTRILTHFAQWSRRVPASARRQVVAARVC